MDGTEKNDNIVPRALGISRLSWLKILISGLVMFALIERALVWTGNINYVPSLLVVGTFTIPLAFVAFLYARDKTPDVSAAIILLCVMWGGILGTVLAGLIEYQTLLHLGVLPMILVGLIEEVAKLAVPALFIFSRKGLREVDAVIIGAASGAGFAALESMGYGLVVLLLSGGNITAATEVVLVRALMAPAAHIAWTALTADALWHLRQGVSARTIRRFVFTFSAVVLLHAAWDSVSLAGGWWFILLGVLSLGWLLLRVRKAADRTGLHIQPPPAAARPIHVRGSR
jgi:RsiW-degrading membrane proteinase PrsW (M82 family)